MRVRALVGRAAELATLEAALAEVGQGRGRVALVGGPAGMGKTRLVDELAEHARATGVRVLRGRAMRDEGTPALWPWWQALQPFPDLVELLEAGDPLAPAVSRGARLREYELLLRSLSERHEHGVLVVLEDLHWADESSLRLLRCSPGRAGMAVVATYRDDEQGDTLRAAITELRRDGATDSVSLKPWAEADIRSYVDGSVEASWVPLLWRHSGGNPLYVREMLRALTDAGLAEAPAPASGVWPLGVPEQLRGIVAGQLERLPDDTRELVLASSVLGADCGAPEVARLSGISPDAVPGAVERASGLLAWRDQRIAFEHVLVRDAVYAAVPADRRVAWHRSLAGAIEAGELPGESVTHRLRSITDDASRLAAVRACRSAATLALRRLAFDRVVELLDAALAVLADDARPVRLLQRCELLLDAADAEFGGGMVEAALRRCQRAAELAERAERPDLLVRAALVVRGVYGPSAQPIMALCDRALAALPNTPDLDGLRARALAQRALALVDTVRPEEADEPSQVALALAERTGDPLALADALRARQQVLSAPHGVAERLELARRMLDLGKDAPPDGELWARLWRIDAALQLGTMTALDEELGRLGLLADRLGWPIAYWHLHRMRAARDLLLGRFAAAEENTGLALRTALQTEDITVPGQDVAVRAELLGLQGRHAELVDRVREFLFVPLPIVQVSAGLFLAGAGDLDTARECFARVRPILGDLPHDGRWLPMLEYAGQLAVILGELDVVRHCYEQLLPFAEFYLAAGAGSLMCHGSTSRVLGVMAAALGMRAEAVRHLTDAIAMDDRIGALPYRTLAEVALAEVLAGGSLAELAEATRLAKSAAITARRLGMAPALRRADGVLRDAAQARQTAVPLTARERDVLVRLARGVSNRAIAEELVLSERTVETHVGNVLSKLGVANRSQAATWAMEHGFTA